MSGGFSHVLTTVSRNWHLFWRLLQQSLRSAMSYRSDFLILLAVSLLTQFMGVIFIASLYQRIPQIQGWTLWEVLFVYAASHFAQGVSTILFDGMWNLSDQVNRGDFDRVLLRPLSPVVQVASSKVGFTGFGYVTTGAVILVLALGHLEIPLSLARAFLFALLIACAVLVLAAIKLAACSISLWTHSPGNAAAFLVHSLSALTHFPITIYPIAIQGMITFAIPFAFVSYYPSLPVLRPASSLWLVAATIAATAVSVAIALAIFRRGVRNYEEIGG